MMTALNRTMSLNQALTLNQMVTLKQAVTLHDFKQMVTFFSFSFLMIAYIALFSALLSRLTALACGST